MIWMHGCLGTDSKYSNGLILFIFQVMVAFHFQVIPLSRELFPLQVSRALSTRRIQEVFGTSELLVYSAL